LPISGSSPSTPIAVWQFIDRTVDVGEVTIPASGTLTIQPSSGYKAECGFDCRGSGITATDISFKRVYSGNEGVEGVGVAEVQLLTTFICDYNLPLKITNKDASNALTLQKLVIIEKEVFNI